MAKYFEWITVRVTTRSGYMMTSPTFAKWRPRRETRGKVTSRLFAGTRSVFSPCYFESYDFRQWEIRGVKKKCRLMNVRAFSGGRTTEHESFSAQRNAGQGAKHLKNEGEFQFLILGVVHYGKFKKCCTLEDTTVSCAIHVLVFIVTPCLFYAVLQSDGKAKAPCFCGKKMPTVCSWRTVTMVLPDHKVAITKQSKHC